MRDLYKKLEAELEKINFNDLWPGFEAIDFALYNDQTVYLKNQQIPKDNRFLANTVIDFQGQPLAIWQVDKLEEERIPILLANIVHEMFHGYQLSQGEARFPDDLKALAYPDDLRNFELKYQEAKLLAQACQGDLDSEGKRELLERVRTLRSYRLKEFGPLIGYEFQIETVEASAEYCGLQALKLLDPVLYSKQVAAYGKKLVEDLDLVFQVRKSAYYSGCLIFLLLKELDIPFNQNISGQTTSIWEDFMEAYPSASGEIAGPLRSLEKEYQAYKAEKKAYFTNFFNQPYESLDLQAGILGFDPMNMVKEGDLLYCKNFILLEDLARGEEFMKKGPLVLQLQPGSLRQVVRCSYRPAAQ